MRITSADLDDLERLVMEYAEVRELPLTHCELLREQWLLQMNTIANVTEGLDSIRLAGTIHDCFWAALGTCGGGTSTTKDLSGRILVFCDTIYLQHSRDGTRVIPQRISGSILRSCKLQGQDVAGTLS